MYFIYWLIVTKKDLNKIGAKIPTAWLLIIPIVSIYWYYKFAEAFSDKITRDKSPVLWFVLLFFGGEFAEPILQY